MLQLMAVTYSILFFVLAHTRELEICHVLFISGWDPSWLCVDSFTKYENQDVKICSFVTIVWQGLTIELWLALPHREQPASVLLVLGL